MISDNQKRLNKSRAEALKALREMHPHDWIHLLSVAKAENGLTSKSRIKKVVDSK